MSCITYVPKRFSNGHKFIIDHANRILRNLVKQGYCLTLRQLYYEFVKRNLIKNEQKEYKRLGSIIGDARLAGLIDWEWMEDRIRNLQELQHFEGVQDALNKVAGWYHVDLWKNQQYRPEVWIEKDALMGMIHGPCTDNDIPYFVCRGYTSLSEMWRASMRLRRNLRAGQTPYIIHFGDHDPSGMDMSRDIFERLSQTFCADCQFERVALNMDQIEEMKPPPNPAKITDSRYKTYVQKFGDDSWELDALDPSKFRELIEGQLKNLRDDNQWAKDVAEKKKGTDRLLRISQEWDKSPVSKKKPRKKKPVKKAVKKPRKRKDS